MCGILVRQNEVDKVTPALGFRLDGIDQPRKTIVDQVKVMMPMVRVRPVAKLWAIRLVVTSSSAVRQDPRFGRLADTRDGH
jgi:hypothetical protein